MCPIKVEVWVEQLHIKNSVEAKVGWHIVLISSNSAHKLLPIIYFNPEIILADINSEIMQITYS
jgi:hypothetical protein